jgi:hypothetical protein
MCVVYFYCCTEYLKHLAENVLKLSNQGLIVCMSFDFKLNSFRSDCCHSYSNVICGGAMRIQKFIKLISSLLRLKYFFFNEEEIACVCAFAVSLKSVNKIMISCQDDDLFYFSKIYRNVSLS